jgi:RimJ/RimL family protein N-acetyltransferase
MKITETDRLTIRHLTFDDAEFIFSLVNQPPFLQFIGDKGVRNLDDARNYIRNVPMSSYEKYGFGSFCVTLTESGTPIGMSGLIKRDALDRPDIGFAILPQYWRQGYAYEAANAIVEYAKNVHHLDRISGIVNPENEASIGLLTRLGFRFERMVLIGNETKEIQLFQKDLR